MLLGRHAAMAALRRDQPEDRLERSAYTLLTRLRTQGPMSIGQLAEAFGLDASTVNRQTAALLRAGLAERIPDPDGGVARKLRVTAEGVRRLELDRDWAIAGLARVLTDWTDAEVAELSRVLTRLNTSIEHTEARPWPRL
ncbi:MarR family winged helix-turn-helix transcriptional regulator [Streptacidiphilus sp. MAP12-20]|uniref:MarR family winged helix-turn-helix transcriptional regulator n=1 Tax=Streptacidiphilus sp. MAP12-20 TaxID=3156299 RepID=UPI003515914F